jgi:hypothetical protein
MRKIERLMNAAISESKDWKNANTEVVNVDGVSKVYLHDNLIAEVVLTALAKSISTTISSLRLMTMASNCMMVVGNLTPLSLASMLF